MGYAAQIDAGVPYTCTNFDDTGVGECVEKPPCQGDDDCHENEICEKIEDARNTCVEGCRCDNSESCERDCVLARPVCTDDNRCSAGCQTAADCDGDEECVDNECQMG